MFYNAALVLNLALDLVLQTYLSYLQMVGVGVHTADGQLLGSMTDFQDIFESYPMQKSLGKLLFKYCWPCTFFVPFLFEPVVAQFLPKHIAKILVGADPRIRGEMAEKAFELNEMEPGLCGHHLQPDFGDLHPLHRSCVHGHDVWRFDHLSCLPLQL